LHYLSEIGLDRPQWSPDGSRLVFLARSGPGYPPIHVWIVGANSRGLKRIDSRRAALPVLSRVRGL